MPTKTKKKAELSWKPVARGKRYCSQACGRGCTRKEYKRAYELAHEASVMLGGNWKLRLQENLGWFAHVISPCKRIHISLHDDNNCTAFLDVPRDWSGGKWAMHGSTPMEAVRRVIQEARADAKHIATILEGL